MRRIAAGTPLPAAALPPAAAIAPLRGPSRPALPRPAAEAARIEALIAPPPDVSAPEPVEAMPGPAAASRKLRHRDAVSQPSEREMDSRIGDGGLRAGAEARLRRASDAPLAPVGPERRRA